jgi:hypothetical protein
MPSDRSATTPTRKPTRTRAEVLVRVGCPALQDEGNHARGKGGTRHQEPIPPPTVQTGQQRSKAQDQATKQEPRFDHLDPAPLGCFEAEKPIVFVPGLLRAAAMRVEVIDGGKNRERTPPSITASPATRRPLILSPLRATADGTRPYIDRTCS